MQDGTRRTKAAAAGAAEAPEAANDDESPAAAVSVAELDFDKVLKHIGERGSYQLYIYYLLCIPATLPAAWLAFIQARILYPSFFKESGPLYHVFVSASPEHWCRVPGAVLDSNLTLGHRKNLTVPRHLRDGRLTYESCRMYDINFTDLFLTTGAWPEDASPLWPTAPCRFGWEYDHTDYDRTLVTDLDVVCDNEWLVTTASTFFYVGSLIGNLIFGRIADRMGRRTAFFIIIGCQVTLSTLTAFSSSYAMYTVLRTLVGLTFPADFQIPFILENGYWWIIPESPRWLLTQNRIEEAEEIVQKMAKVNKVPIPPGYLKSMVSVHSNHHNALVTLRISTTPVYSSNALIFPSRRKERYKNVGFLATMDTLPAYTI
ncbi:unnamed protein product [Notodromas monacha]|uniref:Uncharacterized protein n=1 Tax=Notodromas monacha TaxID=399045 RepID=A0A7R9GIB7_9CRUS|nr:unnamed protein product [Notodromas monacha]CAG0922428.1 unnamed protein product [Notodromas monacha]